MRPAGHRRCGAARRARGVRAGAEQRPHGRSRGLGGVRAGRRMELHRHRAVRVAAATGVAVRRADGPARLRLVAGAARGRRRAAGCSRSGSCSARCGARCWPTCCSASRRGGWTGAGQRASDRRVCDRAPRARARDAGQRVRRCWRTATGPCPENLLLIARRRAARRDPVRRRFGRRDDALPDRRGMLRAHGGPRDRRSAAASPRCASPGRSRCCSSSPTSRPRRPPSSRWRSRVRRHAVRVPRRSRARGRLALPRHAQPDGPAVGPAGPGRPARRARRRARRPALEPGLLGPGPGPLRGGVRRAGGAPRPRPGGDRDRPRRPARGRHRPRGDLLEDPRASRPRARRPRCCWRTSAWRPSCARTSSSCGPRGPGSSRRATRSAAGWSATCTTARSPGWSRWRSTCAWPAAGFAEGSPAGALDRRVDRRGQREPRRAARAGPRHPSGRALRARPRARRALAGRPRAAARRARRDARRPPAGGGRDRGVLRRLRGADQRRQVRARRPGDRAAWSAPTAGCSSR